MPRKSTPNKRARDLARAAQARRDARGPAAVYDDLTGPADAGEVMWRLAMVSVGRMAVERAEADLRTWVGEARASGCSWSEIAHRLNVTRQAASQLFGSTP